MWPEDLSVVVPFVEIIILIKNLILRIPSIHTVVRRLCLIIISFCYNSKIYVQQGTLPQFRDGTIVFLNMG